MLPVRGKSSENVSGYDFYWIAPTHRGRAREARFAQGPLYPSKPTNPPARSIVSSHSSDPPITTPVNPERACAVEGGHTGFLARCCKVLARRRSGAD